MKEFKGLKAERICFSEDSVIVTSNCYAITAYTQISSTNCDEAYEGQGGKYEEMWINNRGDNPDV